MARPTGESARDKLNIFLAIVPFVLSRKESTVDEIAEHFGVRPEIVHAAVSAIACDGGAGEARHGFDNELFNIEWDPFLDDGTVILTVAETLRVPAPFSARQKAIFLAGLELLRAHPHYRRLPEFDSLIEKLGGNAGTDVANVFSVNVDRNDETAGLIQDAIDAAVCLSFTYVSNEGVRTERTIEPYRQDVTNGQRYVRGYCLSRDDLRTFNLDSIESVVVSTTPIENRAIDALSLSASLFHPREDDIVVTVDIEADALALIAPYRQPGFMLTKNGDRVSVSIPFTHVPSAVRMISVVSGIATITEPSHVRDAVAASAQAALEKYRASA
jgi:proteasome accessory factor C